MAVELHREVDVLVSHLFGHVSDRCSSREKQRSECVTDIGPATMETGLLYASVEVASGNVCHVRPAELRYFSRVDGGLRRIDGIPRKSQTRDVAY